MGFGWQDALAGAGGGLAGFGLYQALKGGGNSQVDLALLESPEQRAARQGLLDFARTGRFGNYSAGDAYGGSFGDFAMSALEKSATGQIGDRLNSGPGEMFGLGDQALRDLLTTEKYNPLNQEGVYSGLSGVIDRTTREASDAVKRNAAFGGRLYSSDTVRNLGQVESRGAENKSATLASLFDNYIGRKVGGINTAFNANQQAEDIKRGRISDAFQFGGLQRNLNTARDQAFYNDFLRQRQEKGRQVDALTSVANKDGQFGVPNVSVPNDNPWARIMGLLAQFGGSALGRYAGAA